MPLAEWAALFALWATGGAAVTWLTHRQFRAKGFSFHFCFSLIYLCTFYLGFPLTAALVLAFEATVPPFEYLALALLIATMCYGLYHVAYRSRIVLRPTRLPPLLAVNQVEAKLTWILLAAVSLVTLAVFIWGNGLLFFTLDSYSQVFSRKIFGAGLKRFFYFFIPAMLIVYFLRPDVRGWWVFLATTVGFGALTYLAVGGTRANIALPFAMFLFIGLTRGLISRRTVFLLGGAGVFAMFWLAVQRYGLRLTGAERIHTFLYLTRDTLSPWENFALLLQKYDQVDFQGLAPIVREFYVFIPRGVWPDRPDLVVNTANYFTWEIREYFAGVALSPTVLGSFLIMGGVVAMALGSVAVGLVTRGIDRLYEASRNATKEGDAALGQAFCFGLLFQIVVLVREGFDAFISRFVFYSAVFLLCVLTAKLLARRRVTASA